MELFITLTKGMGEPTYGQTLAVSHHVLHRRFFAGHSLDTRDFVVRRLSRGKYIILCES